MKELSIEEKAYDSNYKTYTELINRLEGVKDAIKKQNYGIAMDILCKPYPEYQIITSTELNESEDDRIRKAIRTIILSSDTKQCQIVGVSQSDMLAWLEKQGEHANFLSKIQVGDKVTRNEDGVLINLSQLNRVAKPSDDIDAEKQRENTYNKELSELLHKVICRFINDPDIPYYDREKVSMKVLHYVERLEKQKPVEPQQDMLSQEKYAKAVDECIFGEQKPADKVEPKFKVGDSIRYKNSGAVFTIKSVFSDHYSLTNNEGLLYFMFQDKYELVEQKPAWSEEDETDWTNTMIMIKECAANHYTKDSIDLVLNWLKSLKDRYTWKPSEEQMQVLSNAGNSYRPFEEGHKVLWSLYNDLKKLKS